MSTLATRPLGDSGLQITTLGLGTSAMGGTGWAYSWGPQSDAASLGTMHHALRRGINWIDTAPVYGLGHAEELVGRMLRTLPAGERPLVFTKVGMQGDPAAPRREPRHDLRPETIRRECEASLRRLGVPRIDLYQLHWAEEAGVPIEYSWAEMLRLQEEGKIRAAGVCTFDVGLLAICAGRRRVDALQTPFSLIRRAAGLGEIPWCAEHGTGVLAYSPLASGLLTGAFSEARMRRLAAEDWRRTAPEFLPPRLGRNLELVHALRPIARRHGASLAAVALAWVTRWPGVTAAIVGARAPHQVDDWIAAATLDLSTHDLAYIAAAVKRTRAGDGPASFQDVEAWQWEVGVQE